MSRLTTHSPLLKTLSKWSRSVRGSGARRPWVQGDRGCKVWCFAEAQAMLLPVAQGSIANWVRRKERTEEKEVIGRERVETHCRTTRVAVDPEPRWAGIKLQVSQRGTAPSIHTTCKTAYPVGAPMSVGRSCFNYGHYSVPRPRSALPSRSLRVICCSGTAVLRLPRTLSNCASYAHMHSLTPADQATHFAKASPAPGIRSTSNERHATP